MARVNLASTSLETRVLSVLCLCAFSSDAPQWIFMKKKLSEPRCLINYLFSLSDTLLGSKRRDQFFDEKRNEYFFDRDPDLFSYILKFYRKGTLHYPEDECACSFKGELDFFGILKNNLSECCYEIFQEKHEEFEDYQRRHAKTEDEDFVPKTPREKTWKLFEDPGKNIFGLFLHYTSAVLILISVVASTVETLQCGKVKCGNKYSEQFYVVESDRKSVV